MSIYIIKKALLDALYLIFRNLAVPNARQTQSNKTIPTLFYM